MLIVNCPTNMFEALLLINDASYFSNHALNFPLHLRKIVYLAWVTNLFSVHWRQIPDITDNGPGGHHHVDVGQHVVLGAVPECFSKLWIILDGYRKYGTANLEWPLLELHNAGVVDAGSFRKNEDWKLLWILNMLLQSPEHGCSVLSFRSLKPNLSRGLG